MTTDGVIRVVIVDDPPLVRQGLEAVLGSVADVAVVGQAAEGRAAIDVVADAQPDVVLMDLNAAALGAGRHERSWRGDPRRRCSC